MIQHYYKVDYIKPQLYVILSFLVPIPSPYRIWAELRGYEMSCKVNREIISENKLNQYAVKVSAYYSCLLDKNPIYKNDLIHETV
jgi:hypothetical protein